MTSKKFDQLNAELATVFRGGPHHGVDPNMFWIAENMANLMCLTFEAISQRIEWLPRIHREFILFHYSISNFLTRLDYGSQKSAGQPA